MKKGSVFVTFVAACAFVCAGLVHEARAASRPTKVVVSPPSATVVTGKSVSFTATVFDQNNKKMSGVKLTWSLTSTVAGCSIASNGKLTTTAGTTPLGTYTNLVKAKVTDAAVSGKASVSVLGMPFTGGMFIGTYQCTSKNCDNGEDQSHLAIVATATTFKALSIDGVDGAASQFSGTIKDDNVSATFTSLGEGQISIIGTIKFGATGTASGIAAHWSQVGGSESGTATLSAVSAASGAGPKIGTWSAPGYTPSSGNVYAIFEHGGTLFGVAEGNVDGQLIYFPFSGFWAAPGSVSFGVDGYDLTGGYGTCNSKATSCAGLLSDNSTKAGTWRVGPLSE
jgi:hypothetical protein